MYLLKPEMGGTTDTNKRSFTFHHVSIKTSIVSKDDNFFSVFTFHHVSIKT